MKKWCFELEKWDKFYQDNKNYKLNRLSQHMWLLPQPMAMRHTPLLGCTNMKDSTSQATYKLFIVIYKKFKNFIKPNNETAKA